MGIDEAGKHDASTAIDLDDLLAILRQPRIAKRVFRSARRNNLPAQAEHRRVRNDSKFRKGSPAPRPVRRRTQREKLADVS